jgi:hypothetical protein
MCAPSDSMARVGSPDEIISESTAPKRDPDSTRSDEPTQDTRGVAKDRSLEVLRLEATPEPTPAAYSFDMRGQWEGTVTEVGADEFSVVLCDILNPGAEEYDAVFSLEEVADEDRDLLKEGAILYWTIGYEQRGGQRRRISEVRLRRLPAWSRADLARVEKASRELDDLFAR